MTPIVTSVHFFRLCDHASAQLDTAVKTAQLESAGQNTSHVITSDPWRPKPVSAWRSAVLDDVTTRQCRIVQTLLRHQNAKYFKFDKNLGKSAGCEKFAALKTESEIANCDADKSISDDVNKKSISDGVKEKCISVKENDNVVNSSDVSFDDQESIEWKTGNNNIKKKLIISTTISMCVGEFGEIIAYRIYTQIQLISYNSVLYVRARMYNLLCAPLSIKGLVQF